MSGAGSTRIWVAATVCALALPFVLGSTASTAVRPSLVAARTLVDRAAAGRITAFRPVSSRAASSCGMTTGLVCSEVDVPLDRTGAVPGTVALHVEELPATGVQRGVMFLIAGGPGQGSAHVFDLGSPASASLFAYLFPGYTLVAYDDRGTGASGLLDCPSLQAAQTADAEQAAAAACGNSLGAQGAFYSTAQHAEDLDAVRQALGFSTVGLYGVSYGTKLAMAYALAHPGHVDRLVLDSVLPPELPDPYESNVLRELPATLDAFCSDGGCKSATSSFGGDVVALANKLVAKPLVGKVLEAGGRTTTKRIDGLELLTVVLDADLNPGLAAELPAVVHAARAGNVQPLLRLADLHDATSAESSVDLSSALYAATVCHDGPFPWQPDTPVADRPPLLQAAIAALPAGSLGPFGTWATRFGNADFCLGWPSPTGGAPLGAGPLPNVPMLAVSGGFDMRTPTAGAASVVARFPQGHLLVVPGIGHSTVTADPSGCAAQSLHTWMLGGSIPSACPRSKPLVTPEPALPAPGAAHPKHPAGPLPTYATASKTIHDAEAIWLMTAGVSGEPLTVAGIFGGKLASTATSFRMAGYSISRGVTVSGKVKLTKFGLPLVFQGTVTVGGPGATRGILGLSGGSLRGTLGGRVVG